MDSEKIAQVLIDLRGTRSRAEVAEAIGVSVSALSMYETGARIPRDETKRKIAQYYGKTVEEIFLLELSHIVTKNGVKQHRVHPGHKGGNTMNNHDDDEKKRKGRWLRWLNLYSAAVSTLAVLLAIAHASQKM